MKSRPSTLRERLACYGSTSLAADELLTLILAPGSGPGRETADEEIQRLLRTCGGLAGLPRADFDQLREAHLTAGKAAKLQAVLELAKRLSTRTMESRPQIRCPADAAELVMAEMASLDHEEMRVLVLDTKNQVVLNRLMYQGTVNSSVLRAAEIFRPAIVRNCPAILICHNHPSNDTTPSPEDIAVTEQLVQAGKLLDIDLVDHLVIGDGRFVSLKERMRWA